MSRKNTPISRRSFLKGSTATVAGAGMSMTLSARASHDAGSTRADDGSGTVFQHSVASGDPTQTSVMIWTRITGARDPGAQPVHWEVSENPEFHGIAATGTEKAVVENDYTIKVDVTGLQPGTHYWYRFRVGEDLSPVARTNTLPADAEAVRFALVSCSSKPHGFFNAYRSIATRDWGDLEPTVVLHLGDYIYEYGHGDYGEARSSAPEHEIYRLPDYRDRHAEYKKDEDLQALHLKYPMINIWDDHETADNSWKEDAHNHGEGEEGSAEVRVVGDEEDGVLWLERKNAGRRAFFEWMPIRPVGKQYEGKADAELSDDQLDEKYRIWRTFPVGGLADLIMMDTRLERNSDEAIDQSDLDAINDPNRRMLGTGGQEEWLFGADGKSGELGNSTATWQILGQQIMVGQFHVVGTPADTPGIKGGVIFNTDQWDGWQSSREQLYDAIEAKNAQGGNIVILTGDIHTSWAMDITRDPNNPAVYDPFTGRGSIAVEFVCTSVTSPGMPELKQVQDGIRVSNPHMKYIDLAEKGYMTLDVTRERVSGTWHYMDTIEEPSDGLFEGPTFYVEAGQGKHYLLRDGGVPGVPQASGNEPS